MAFNAKALKFEETTELHLKHPGTGEALYDTEGLEETDESKPVIYHLYGKASKKYKVALDKLLAKDAKYKRLGRVPTNDEKREDSVSFLAELSIKMDNMNHPETDEPLDNKDAFVSLLGDEHYSWIAEQANTALGDPSNFLAK